MSSAFTLDDTAPQLLYSSGWAMQSPDVDKSTERFFGGTYHVAIADGATLNMSVAGTSIAVYGSVGPGHSNYSVQVDDTVTLKSAYAPKPAFQQLLFEHTFPPSESNRTHFVSLKAIHSLSGNWLDVDYVTVGAGGDPTDGANSAPENTTPPPWEGVIPQGDGLDSVQGNGSNSSTSHSDLNRATAALSITFGILLFLALLALLAIFLRRRTTTSSRRSPSSSYTNGMAISLPTNFEHKLHGGPLAGQVEHDAATPASSVCSVGIMKGPGYLDGDGTALLAYAPQLHVKHSSGFAPPSPFSPPSSPPMFSPSSSPAPLLPPMSPAGPDSPASSTTRVHPYAHPLAQSHQREDAGAGVDEVVESPVHRWRQ